MDRIITVTGRGKMHVKPDVIVLNIIISDWRKNCDDMIEESKRQTELIRDFIEDAGFKREDLKTISYDFDKKTERYKDRYGDTEYRFVGYEFTHKMKIEFDINNKVFGSILFGISNLELTPEISLSYKVKNEEKVKNELLKKCVKDSTEKAGILAQASNVKLGNILSIKYSWDEIEIVSRYEDAGVYCDSCLDGADYSFALEPEDIELSDVVTIQWEII